MPFRVFKNQRGQMRRRFTRVFCLLAMPVLLMEQAFAAPPVPLHVVYEISLTGIPIGIASLDGTVNGRRYDLVLTSRFTGLVGLVMGLKIDAKSQGTASDTQIIPSRYDLTVASSGNKRTVLMKLTTGDVTTLEVDPPLPERPDRVPVLPEHKKGIVDPLGGLLFPLSDAAMGKPLNCERSIPVFDGAARFDINLTPDHEETLKIIGYDGPVAVCSVRYVPVAGHRPKRGTTAFMETNRDIEVKLAPYSGSQFAVPLEIAVPTLVGKIRLSAVRIGPEPVQSAQSTTGD
jgi:hypothetical protein